MIDDPYNTAVPERLTGHTVEFVIFEEEAELVREVFRKAAPVKRKKQVKKPAQPVKHD